MQEFMETSAGATPMSELAQQVQPEKEEIPEGKHIVFHLLPPTQLEHAEAIRYQCSECGNIFFSYTTQKHATEDEKANTYEFDNVGEHISVDPTEHTADFVEADAEVKETPSESV